MRYSRLNIHNGNCMYLLSNLTLGSVWLLFSESPVSACFFPLQKSKKVKREKKRTHYEMREDPVLYGELVVLGTDGELPNGNRGRRRSRFQVWVFEFLMLYKNLENIRNKLSLELYVFSTIYFDFKFCKKIGHNFP